jgi:hypothetical protein
VVHLVSKVSPSERLKRVLLRPTVFARDDVFISVGTQFQFRPPLSIHVHFCKVLCGIVDTASHPTPPQLFLDHNEKVVEAMINMSPRIPFLMAQPQTLKIPNAISSGRRALMLDMVKWYGTYCMPPRRGSTCQPLSLRSGMICRLPVVLEGLVAARHTPAAPTGSRRHVHSDMFSTRGGAIMRAGPRGYVFHTGGGPYWIITRTLNPIQICVANVLHMDIYDPTSYVRQQAASTLLHRASTRTRGRVIGISHPSQILLRGKTTKATVVDAEVFPGTTLAS